MRDTQIMDGFLVLHEYKPRPWVDRAACRGMDVDLFFPDHGESAEEAKAVCKTCTVTSECLSWALETQAKHGVFGGLSPKQRRPSRMGR